ncbi:MAG: sigma-54 interaction domain-containing protein [Flavobacteriales bacterium]
MKTSVQQAKQRFGIIGSSKLLDRAIDTAIQVAATDLSVLITGESGPGKEVMPKIIHSLSPRKHATYIAVNCGAIPEGTIDSELFGHVKGSFTGASSDRQGYFEVADNGTIFLDEVAELPKETQVRLLRVLESGEFIKVGSSKEQKTNVRVIAATNINMLDAIANGKFREDLYYRLNTVPIHIPSLRERKEDIHLLFRKFAVDFAEKYRMPPIRLSEDAKNVLINHHWPGNIRQLKNIAEQVSVIEQNREVQADTLIKYLPAYQKSNLPVLFQGRGQEINEREILYSVLFDMKKDVNELKKLVAGLMETDMAEGSMSDEKTMIINKLYNDTLLEDTPITATPIHNNRMDEEMQVPEVVEESLSLEEKEKELIERALEKHRGKRKYAARELGISERTLYRKIKEYKLKG